MSLERKPDLHLEVAHVLFMDVVGFSKLLINDQSEILEQLNRLVRETPHFREAEAAGKLIRLATGDGMALVFSNSAEAPEKLQQAKAKERTLPAAAAAAASATSAKPAWRSRAWIAALVIVAAAIAVAGFYIFSHRSSSKAILEKSIAVLPFENLSRDPDNAYFADGIQDEILTRLSKIADLEVISVTFTQHGKTAA